MEISVRKETSEVRYPMPELTYLGNVANSKAAAFYRDHGVNKIAKAYELEPVEGVPLMFSKHCLRYSMGWCPKFQKKNIQYREPLYLEHKDTRLRLDFDCKNCMMMVSKQ
jgi:putative protease